MPALNPFLRALFQSSVLGQSLPAQNYVLLVPTTEALLNGVDQDNGRSCADLVQDEDFLASHILRIVPPPNGTTPDINVRDNKGKAKTYPTVNGRTVIIKENMVYSNKGFKQLVQAQLLSDALYRPPKNEMQEWLLYYISKPLVGMYARIVIQPAFIGSAPQLRAEDTATTATQAPQPEKKDVRTFGELLNQFPMIARQMQPGLERLFNEFGKELGRPQPPPPSLSRTNSMEGPTLASESGSIKTNGSVKLPFNSTAYFDDEEDLMRKALESAVTSAIDLFQEVDKQQLSKLGATTDLTGPAVEKLIERYVAESVHDSLLFPRLCALHRTQDQELDRRIRQMDCLDVSQVGITMDNGKEGKRDLLSRIDRGVATFRKIGVAGSPQQMLEVLLDTQKAVSDAHISANGRSTDAEKLAVAMTVNADILVSMLLLVIVRSQVRHLQARLAYMQRFIYIDDVESGELGYALSTLEAVLAYLAQDAAGLRIASKQNQKLWDAVKQGNVPEIRAIFEGRGDFAVADDITEEPTELPSLSHASSRIEASGESSINGSITSDGTNLAHVFPFQAPTTPRSVLSQKRKKRTHFDSRSMSVSSSVSILSRKDTLGSTLSGIEGDTSIESLAQTQDPKGNSVLMMSVEKEQQHALQYLLSLSEHYPTTDVLADTTSEGTTLLSAALQVAHTELVDVILGYLHKSLDLGALRAYFAKADNRGRTAAHYLFNYPGLITKIPMMIPWQQRDRIGHTPLFATCRSYDHTDYISMVSDALLAATDGQGDGQPLRLEDHTDNKGNTLLHIINDPALTDRVLHLCDCDPNAMNDKKFTPLMLVSKYGRIDMVRLFFGDPRVDVHLRELRGLTAVELAKDDEVRNRIDDLTLFSLDSAPMPNLDNRLTAVVRSFFVEDASTRFILKSGAPNSATSTNTYTITTSRRSLQDFEKLAGWLATDHQSSYMPTILASNFRSPFQVHSRPSRAVLHATQTALDRFLKIMLAHPTISQNEMLWEFFLVPDMQSDQMSARAQLKAELLAERIADDYDPLTSHLDLNEVDLLVTHSREIVRKLNASTRAVIRRGYGCGHNQADVSDALFLASSHIALLGAPSSSLPQAHITAFAKFANVTSTEPSSSPLLRYVAALTTFHSTILAMQSSLLKPITLVTQITQLQRELQRNRTALQQNSLPRKGLLNIGILEENRLKSVKDTEAKIAQSEVEVDRMGKELRYTREVVVDELAGWTTWRGHWLREEIRRLARATIVKERERLKGMQRAMRNLKEARM